MNAFPAHVVDCLVVGGGPAGLAAATYLARYRREVVVVDGGASRAGRIPRSRNVPGFPEGISGPRLLERIRLQAEAAGVVVTRGAVSALAHDQDGFQATTTCGGVNARSVLLATGCSDREPLQGLSARGTRRGIVRWCPICDGYEAMDKRIVLIGEPEHGAGHALFLRTYTRQLVLVLLSGRRRLDASEQAALDAAGIEVLHEAPVRVSVGPGPSGRLELADGRELSFDVVYPMTGGRPHSRLALALGAKQAADGRLEVDLRQQTSVPGLYAAGDVVASLGQVAVAFAEGAVAATAIHRSLPANFR